MRCASSILRNVTPPFAKHSTLIAFRLRPGAFSMAPKRKLSALAGGAAEVDPAAPRRSSRRLKGAEPNNENSTASAAPARDAGKKSAKKSVSVAKTAGTAKKNASKGSASPAADDGERRYWLMKAEPETRLENGHDVSFSIDDLASRTDPEPWDGIRNYVARNNLRAMKKGDLAFFYHSNCKEPGIVGTMEIVQEHSPDLTAHDPKAPYYDASSKPGDPKWSVVHVVFQSKFADSITLKELREMGGPGKPLETMQMLKQSRLSVSSVSKQEWEHLMAVAAAKGEITTSK